MWEPVGPLPAAVYRRRRWVALASVLTVAGLVTVVVGGREPAARRAPEPVPAAVRATAEGLPDLAGTSDGPRMSMPTSASSSGTATTDTTAPPRGAVGPAAAASSPSEPPSDDQQPTSAQAGSLTAAVVPSTPPPGTTSERIRPDDTPRPTVAAQPPVPVPRTGPVPCTNAMLTTAAEVDPAVHQVGSRPVLRLVITNVSGQPCVRDLDAARQEIVVWSGDGATRLWSSNDCLNNPTTDLRTLVPGRPVAFALTWGERTTTPGCAQPRTVVPAGSYRLMVRLDDLISPPTPFLRTP